MSTKNWIEKDLDLSCNEIFSKKAFKKHVSELFFDCKWRTNFKMENKIMNFIKKQIWLSAGYTFASKTFDHHLRWGSFFFQSVSVRTSFNRLFGYRKQTRTTINNNKKEKINKSRRCACLFLHNTLNTVYVIL